MVKSVAALFGLLFAASFAGALHPVGDSLAVFRVPLAAVFTLAVIWTDWSRWLRWPLAGLALAAMGQIVSFKLQPPEPGDFTVYQKNIWHGNTQVEALASDILMRAPDVVVLQEVSATNASVLGLLAQSHPHQHRCRFEGRIGNAVVSRLPSTGQAFCSDTRGLAGMQIETEAGPVWVISVHLSWPWPFGQPGQIDPYAQRLAALDGPIVLAGDFNMVPWGTSVQRLAAAARVRRAGPMMPTLYVPRQDSGANAPLPIDHVFAPGGGAIKRLPLLGADHHGLFARIHLAP